MFPEAGNMGKVLPEYLSTWTTDKVRAEGVEVMTNTSVTKVDYKNNQIVLSTDKGDSVSVE